MVVSVGVFRGVIRGGGVDPVVHFTPVVRGGSEGCVLGTRKSTGSSPIGARSEKISRIENGILSRSVVF